MVVKDVSVVIMELLREVSWLQAGSIYRGSRAKAVLVLQAGSREGLSNKLIASPAVRKVKHPRRWPK